NSDTTKSKLISYDEPYEMQSKFRSTSLKEPSKMPQPSQSQSMMPDEESKDFDSLAVLNELCHDNKVTPKWEDKPTADGFASELVFDSLPKFTGYGKKKKDVD